MNTNPKAKARNGKIEFLRFLFSVVILLHHSRYLLGDENSPLIGGSLAVEFFFLVSGYLMMATIEKTWQRDALEPAQPLGKETAGFLLRKAKAVYPELAVVWIPAFLYVGCMRGWTLKAMVSEFQKRVWEMVLLSMTGLGSGGIDSVIWYVSSMLLCMALLYPLIRKFPDIMLRLVMPVSTVLIFGALFQNYNHPREPDLWMGWAFKGNLRAYGELCLGAGAYYLTKKLRSVSLTKAGKWLCTVAQWALYIVTIAYMVEGPSNRDYFYLVLLTVAVSLSFSEQGVDEKLFSNKLSLWLGKFSLPLYLSHLFYAHYIGELLPEGMRMRDQLLIYVLVSCLTALVVMAISQWLRANGDRIWRQIKGLFVVQTEEK